MDRFPSIESEVDKVNVTALKLTLFSVAALCLAYGAYRFYGWWAIPVPLVLGGLAAWENMREK